MAVTYEFDDFTLDGATRRLLRGGEEIRLSPKAFDLLMLLVENRSQAMAKEDLHQKLWPATYVSESNLAGLIAELRRALADAADQPRYIRTMHRFGYWFIGSVRDQPDPGPSGRLPVRYWLVWDTHRIPLVERDSVIGRAQNAAVWIDAAGVSRHHARIRLDGGKATLEDLGSKNGTYVKGQPVTSPVALEDGDQIRIGSVVITFRVPPPPSLTETQQI